METSEQPSREPNPLTSSDRAVYESALESEIIRCRQLISDPANTTPCSRQIARNLRRHCRRGLKHVRDGGGEGELKDIQKLITNVRMELHFDRWQDSEWRQEVDDLQNLHLRVLCIRYREFWRHPPRPEDQDESDRRILLCLEEIARREDLRFAGEECSKVLSELDEELALFNCWLGRKNRGLHPPSTPQWTRIGKVARRCLDTHHAREALWLQFHPDEATLGSQSFEVIAQTIHDDRTYLDQLVSADSRNLIPTLLAAISAAQAYWFDRIHLNDVTVVGWRLAKDIHGEDKEPSQKEKAHNRVRLLYSLPAQAIGRTVSPEFAD